MYLSNPLRQTIFSYSLSKGSPIADKWIMNISEGIVKELSADLSGYIEEYGFNRGIIMFSKDLGKVENRLYNEIRNHQRFDGADLFSGPWELFQEDIDGELAVVEDLPPGPPFLEVV